MSAFRVIAFILCIWPYNAMSTNSNNDGYQELVEVAIIEPQVLNFEADQELIKQFAETTIAADCIAPSSAHRIPLQEVMTCLGLDTAEGYARFVEEHGHLKELLKSNKFAGIFDHHYIAESRYIDNQSRWTTIWSFSCETTSQYRATVLKIYPQNIAGKKRIWKLHISSSLLCLPANFPQMVNLTHLDLSHNKTLGIIPKAIYQLQQLQYLCLDGCGIKEIPAGISLLASLTELSLGNNNITKFPAEIALLGKLGSLNLTWMDPPLKEIPEAILRLGNLKTLNMYHNELAHIPEALFTLAHLQVLNLKHNQLFMLPSVDSVLGNLESLDLSENKIGALPQALGRMMPKLHSLLLNNNKLEMLPESIGHLVKLEILNVNFNEIKFLPESIANLAKLKELLLDYNCLESLPRGIGKLRSLKKLMLHGNRNLKSLPVELTYLPWYVTYEDKAEYEGLKTPLQTEQHPELKLAPEFEKWFKTPEWLNYNCRGYNPRLY